jgi:molecular chaperone DnaK
LAVTLEQLFRMIIDLQDIDLPSARVTAIGIDLGTTNSTVAEAVWDPDTPNEIVVKSLDVSQETLQGVYMSPIVPSVVTITGDNLFVGEGAKRLRSSAGEYGLVQNQNLFFDCKNDIGTSKTYHKAPEGFRSAADIGAKVISFLKDAATSLSKSEFTQTVVTVPASFQVAQRKETCEAAMRAGVDVSTHVMLDEPVAAFLEYANSYDLGDFEIDAQPKNLLVFDFGGGTCDVAIFSLKQRKGDSSLGVLPLAVSRYHRLGGGDIDAAIIYEILLPQLIEQNGLGQFDLSFSDKKQKLEPALIGAAEALKIGICTTISRLISFGKYESANKDAIIKTQPGLHSVKIGDKILTLNSPTISAEQFEELLEPFLDVDRLYARSTEYRLTNSIFAPVEDAIDRAELDGSDIDFVLLAGGSCQIPHVKMQVEDYLPDAQILSFPERDESQTAIAKGAALHALSMALRGEGLVKPIAHDQISIKTASGDKELVPKGAKLPFPDKGNGKFDLGAPESSETKPVDVRVEVVGGEENRVLISQIWRLNPPVTRGEVLNASYAYDENQVLKLDISRMDAGRARPFTATIENPFTNVVNPHETEMEIEKIETDIRTGKVPASEKIGKFTELADRYADLEQYEKAVEIVRRVLRQKGPDPHLLNKAAIFYSDMGDHTRAEKFYREAASLTKWSGPWFNLALTLKNQRKYADALVAVHTAAEREDKPAYRVFEAEIMERLGDEIKRDEILNDYLPRFGGLRALQDFELGWYATGCKLIGDKDGEAKARDERQRRRKAGAPQKTGGALPEEIRTEDNE